MKKNINIINGIGTNVGKTFITSLLIKEQRLKFNSQICVLKPVASGVLDPFKSDTAILLKAANITPTKEALQYSTLHFFKDACSINIAAQKEDIKLSFKEIADFCIQKIEYAMNHNNVVFIEMAGGLCSPVTSGETMLELTSFLTKKFQGNCNNILVTTDYLGSISHTVLCCKAFEFDKIIWNPRTAGNKSLEIKKTIEFFINKNLYII